MAHGTITNVTVGRNFENTSVTATARTLTENRKINHLTYKDDISDITKTVINFRNLCKNISINVKESITLVYGGSEINNLAKKFSDLDELAGNINSELVALQQKLESKIQNFSNKDLEELFGYLQNSLVKRLTSFVEANDKTLQEIYKTLNNSSSNRNVQAIQEIVNKKQEYENANKEIAEEGARLETEIHAIVQWYINNNIPNYYTQNRLTGHFYMKGQSL